jgi:hypothetical protein
MGQERRRSPRLAIRILLRVEWTAGEQTISKQAVSESISAHGVLVKLTADNPPLGRVLVENLATAERQHAHVVKVGAVSEGSKTYMVGLEFETPCPEFWGTVYFYSAQGVEILHLEDNLLLNKPDHGCATKPRTV